MTAWLVWPATGCSDRTSPQEVSPQETAADDVLPSLELLEFLGDWEDDDGQWKGPDFFEEMPTVDQEQDPGGQRDKRDDKPKEEHDD